MSKWKCVMYRVWTWQNPCYMQSTTQIAKLARWVHHVSKWLWIQKQNGKDNWSKLSLAIYPTPESRWFSRVQEFHILCRLKQENSIRTALSNLQYWRYKLPNVLKSCRFKHDIFKEFPDICQYIRCGFIACYCIELTLWKFCMRGI